MPVSVVEIRGDTSPLEDALSKLPAEGRAAARGMAKKMLSEMEDLDQAMDPLKDAIKSARGVSEREAKRMAKGIVRANARAANTIEKDYERSFSGQFSAIKGLSGAVFGGVAGDAFDAAEAMQGASGAAAAIGAALGGIAVGGLALVGVAQGIRALAAAGVEARDRLTEAGLAIEGALSPENVAALDAYTAAMAELSTAMEFATVKAGAEFAPAATRLEQSVSGVKFAAAEASGGVGTLTTGVMDLSEWFVTTYVGTKYLVQGLQFLASAGAEAAAEAKNTAEATRDANAAILQRRNLTWDMLRDGFGPLIEAEDEAQLAAEATAAAHDKAAAAAGRQKKAQLDLRRATAAAAAALAELVAEEEEEEAAVMAAIKANRELSAEMDIVGRDLEKLARQLEAMGPRLRMEDQAKIWHRWLSEGFAAIDALGQQAIGTMGNVAELQEIKLSEVVDKRRKSDKRAAREDAKRRKEGIAALLAEGQITEAQADKEIEYIEGRRDAELKAAEKMTASEQKAARKSHRLAKAAEVAQAFMYSATSALSLIPFFSMLGPGAPLAAAGVVAPFLLTELALIRSQKPPELAGGRVPGMSGDHDLVGIQRSEVVLNSRAAAALGAEAAQDLNDTGRTGDDAPIVAVFEVNGRELLQLTGRRRRTGHLTTQRF